jgi:hypothetical protein
MVRQGRVGRLGLVRGDAAVWALISLEGSAREVQARPH